jgi:hypothetical protein
LSQHNLQSCLTIWFIKNVVQKACGVKKKLTYSLKS